MKKVLMCIFYFFIITACLTAGCDFNDERQKENTSGKDYDKQHVEIIEDDFPFSENLRGIWVCTVYMLDFPYSYTKNDSALKSQLDSLVKKVKDLNFNSIFFQVRPCADAFYKSNIFPWSKFISGIQGVAPNNGFDPLEYIIKVCHENNIELHAWINPYRIQLSQNETLASNNPANLYPETTMLTGGKIMFNPGVPEARQLIIDGVKEIVSNYNVNGIHFDDYFYPPETFDDLNTYAKHKGIFTNIKDWRRNNNDLLIRDTFNAIKSINENVAFSVSPVGIWANKSTNSYGSNTSGYESYSSLYADTRKWVLEGWLDCIIPQIYYYIGQPGADYTEVVSWWNNLVEGTNVNLCVGLAGYKVYDISQAYAWQEKNAGQIYRQLNYNSTKENICGYCVFRCSNVLNLEDLNSVFIKR